MDILIAQINSVVGDFSGNVKKISEAYSSVEGSIDLVVTPELSVCGYPPLDLVTNPDFPEQCDQAIEILSHLTKEKDCALVVGAVLHIEKHLRNVVVVLYKGQRIFTQAKSLLPTYDVFDEARYFAPAEAISLLEFKGEKIALAICEDLWAVEEKTRGYKSNPVHEYIQQGASLVISISASPYEIDKAIRREKSHSAIVLQMGVPLLYVNCCGATDSLIFDGGSFFINSAGEVVERLPYFCERIQKISIKNHNGGRLERSAHRLELLRLAIVTGISEYFRKSHSSKALIGLSGGIDSAVVATLATQALGKENVLGVALPGPYSSFHSLEDARELAEKLQIKMTVIAIGDLCSTFSKHYNESLGDLSELAGENLQARMRGLVLMSLANSTPGSLVLNTGNKSEFAMGYSTLYGDMIGALAPIGDLYKTEVFELAHFLNSNFDSPIPDRSITKPPSAELRPGQIDEDTLPPYDKLDLILKDFIESDIPRKELSKRWCHLFQEKSEETIENILKKVDANEYKRAQAPPILKLSHRAFGLGRRVPISRSWNTLPR